MAQSNKPIVGRRGDSNRVPSVQNRPGQYLRHADGWNNFLAAAGWNNKSTGRGIGGIDRKLDTRYNPKATVAEGTLRALYRGDGPARRVIDLAVEAMTSHGFEINGDPEGMIIARMEETGIPKSLESLVRWSRLYGGALGVINVDDGQRYDAPLNFQGIRKVYDVKVYNRWRITYTTSDLYRDPYNPKFGKPEFYWVQPLMGVRYRVHESRTLRFDGAPVDDVSEVMNQGWGDSYLQGCFDSLASFSSVYDSVEAIIDDFITSTVSIKELSELMASPGGEKLVLKRLMIMDKAKAITNTRILDQDETFQKVASSVAGLSDLMDRYAQKLSLDTGIPVTLLMGESPAGLNATGDADLSNWYDKMESQQQKDLKAPIEYLTRLMFLSKDDYFNGTEPKNWYVDFHPLWQPTAKEKSEIEKSENDQVIALVDRGIMSEDEARDLPQIRDRYNLKGPAPEPQGGFDESGNPIDPEAPADGADDGEEPKKEDKKRTDSLPADPVQARADLMGACRYLLRDTRGRRRGDAAKFLEQTVILQRDRFDSADDAAAWVKAHGFKADNMEATKGTYRFSQRDRGEFVPRSEKYLTPVNGVEVVLARVKDA